MPATLFWPLLAFHLALRAAAVSVAALRGQGFAGWRGLTAGVAELAPIWRTRRDVQRRRRATTFQIARMLAWNPLAFVGRKPVIRPLR
jgi:hypothetical protein